MRTSRYGFSAIRGRKLLTPSFVRVVLGTTNPRQAWLPKMCLGATPWRDRIGALRTRAVARRTVQS